MKYRVRSALWVATLLGQPTRSRRQCCPATLPWAIIELIVAPPFPGKLGISTSFDCASFFSSPTDWRNPASYGA